jgi:hypothetical protein
LRLPQKLTTTVALAAALTLATSNVTGVGAVSGWVESLAPGSHAQAQAQPAITTATTNPVTFTAACDGSAESASLSWSSAGAAVTGYAVYVSSSATSGFALDTTQPSSTALSVVETYTTSTGKKYYRLEAKTANWAFPGTTIANAREAAVSGTNGGYLTMAASGTKCAPTA